MVGQSRNFSIQIIALLERINSTSGNSKFSKLHGPIERLGEGKWMAWPNKSINSSSQIGRLQVVSQMDDPQNSTLTSFRTMETCKCHKSDFLWCRVVEEWGKILFYYIFFWFVFTLKKFLIYASKKVHDSYQYCLICLKY